MRWLRCLMCLVAGGCSSSDGDPQSARTPLDDQSLTAISQDVVVAEVDGVPIHARSVARQARLTNKKPRAALEDLIEAELLAKEALRRGVVDPEDALLERRRAAVQKLIEQEFEAKVTPEDIPEAVLMKTYRQMRDYFVHIEMRKSAQILLKVASDAPATEVEEVRAIATDLHRLARATKTLEEFLALTEGAAYAEKGIESQVLPSFTFYALEEPFAKELFSLKPGQVGKLVRSSSGFHVIRMLEIIPPSNTSYADAKPEMRRKLWDDQRPRLFDRWVQQIFDRHQVTVMEEALTQSSEQSTNP